MFRVFSRQGAAVSLLFSVALSAFLAVPANAQSASHGDDGSVWWNELISENPERSRDFYTSVIGWTPKIVSADDNSRAPAPGEKDYTLFMQNGSETAGLAKYDGKEPGDPKPGWLTYIQVPDVDAAVVEALKKGGKVLKAPADADNVGRIAILQDPDGNSIGLFTPIGADAKVAGH